MTQEYPKWSPRGSPNELRRVQNGVPEGPKWIPEGPKWRSMAQDGGPKDLRERWELARSPQDAAQGAQGRLVHGFATDFKPQMTPQGVPNRSKKSTKSVSKNIFVSDRVLDSNLIDLGVQKTTFLEPENRSKCI